MRSDLIVALSLATLLLTAAVTDARTRRIPNWLTGGGIVIGLLVQALAPVGVGLFDYRWGGLGALQASFGLAAGLGLFLPLYLLRAVGAGDVKLLAMVGVWLGPRLLLGATLLTLLVGGAMALTTMLATRSTRRVASNVQLLLTTAVVGAHGGRLAAFDGAFTSGTRMPYAVAVCVGTLAQVCWLLWQATA